MPFPFLYYCCSAEDTMGCVGSKKEQETLSKGMGNEDPHNRGHTAHYVKDPTAGNSGNKAVSNIAVTSTLVFIIWQTAEHTV